MQSVTLVTNITVEVPDDVDPDELYLEFDPDAVSVMVGRRTVAAKVTGYETTDVFTNGG